MTMLSHEVARVNLEIARDNAATIGARYDVARVEFRAGRMATDDFLKLRAEHDAALLEYDLAEMAIVREQAELDAHNAQMTDALELLEDAR